MDNVIDFINVNRERYLEELKALLAIPSISALPAARRRREALRRLVRGRNAPHRPAERPAHRDARQSGRLRRLARRARRADDPVLRALRRAAGRSAEPVGIAALRGDDSRRRDLRARLGRRQGPGVHALQGRRSASEAERPSAGEHQVHARRRRRGRQRAPRRFRPRPQGRAEAPTSSSFPIRRCSRGAFRRSATASAASSTSRSICAAATPTCTPDRSAARVANPAFVLAQMIAQMKDRGGRIKIPGFYDDVVPLKEEERQAWATLPFNEKQYKKDFGIPKLFGETGYTTLERTWARPTLGGQRPAVGLHGRGRQDGAAGRGDGEGQHAAGAESGSEQDRGSVRGLRAEDHAEDRRAEGSRACTAASRG